MKERADWHDLYRVCRDLTVLASAAGQRGLSTCPPPPRWPPMDQDQAEKLSVAAYPLGWLSRTRRS